MTFATKTTLRARLTRSAALLSLLCSTTPSAHAQTIHWGNNILDTLVQSDGTPLTNAGNFQIELGIFSGGFQPTSANPENWMTNWQPLDAAALNDTARYYSSTFHIIPDSENPANGRSDSPDAVEGVQVQAGQQLWLLVYNNTSMDTGTELFLAGAGTWTLPAISGSQTAMPSNFRLTQVLSAPVFGGANNNRGGGNYSDTPPAYTLQTATFIPEPGTPLLTTAAALALVLVLSRRRRA